MSSNFVQPGGASFLREYPATVSVAGCAKDLEKRSWTCIEVPYDTLYTTFGSGIQCSTCSLWWEF